MSEFESGAIYDALRQVETGPFGSKIHYLPQTGSTNDILRKLADSGMPEGGLVITDEQIAGRGRMGRVWIAPYGTSLLMSLLFRPTLPPTHINRLVMVCGLAIYDAVDALLPGQVAIKWPNDLLLNGKKFTGILPESRLDGDQVRWVIVGMGMNVNQPFDADHPLSGSATSIRVQLGADVSRLDLLTAIMQHVHRWYQQLDNPALTQAWSDRCQTIGQDILIHQGDQHYEGRATGINEVGALLIQTRDGRVQPIHAGEATLRSSNTRD